MPDQWNFNRLGPEVACIDCDIRGPVGDWPTEKREEHYLAHIEAAKNPKPAPAAKPAAKPATKKPAAKRPAAKKPPAK